MPRELGTGFGETISSREATGFRGITVTYPCKELAVSKVKINDPVVQDMGAVDTVVLEPSGPMGFSIPIAAA